MPPSEENTALIIGHPGHELRVFNWLEVTRPTVFVITDGSGKEGRSRLASTAQILKQTGAREGASHQKQVTSAREPSLVTTECVVQARSIPVGHVF